MKLSRLLSIPLLLFLLLPLLALFLRTPIDTFMTNLRAPGLRQAVTLSFSTSFTTTLTIMLLGTPVAFMLARQHSRLGRVLDTLLDLPVVLPPAVAGVALLMAFGRKGILGGVLGDLGITVTFTPVAVILAQMFVAAPLYVKTARGGFSSVDADIVQAAQLDGASPWQAFRFVILPLAWTALLSGAVMAWARALGEFGATIIFAGNFPGRTQTMPLLIYIGFENDLGVALTLAVILVCSSFLVLLVVRGLLHRLPQSFVGY